MNDKPHIRKSGQKIPDVSWECLDRGRIYRGFSPHDAYEWIARTERYVTGKRRNQTVSEYLKCIQEQPKDQLTQ